MFHIVMNIRGQKIKLSDDDKKLIYIAADAPTEDKAESAMTMIKMNMPRAFNYLNNIQPGPRAWARWAINNEGFATFGMKTSNASEEKNSWLGILLRSSNPVSAYFQYMTKLASKFQKRRNRVSGRRPMGLVKKVQDSVESSVKFSRQYVVRSNM
jgi:hypothetical protein